MFNDVSESTQLGDRFEPEAVRRIMWRYFETVAGACERHGGTVEKFIGDAAMAVFGVPTAQEDHALRAVRAAVDLRDELERLDDALERDWGVRLLTRTGVSSGEVVAGDPAGGQALVTGDPVNLAARLEQFAEPGEILIGDATYQLVASAVDVEPAEFSQQHGGRDISAWRLVHVRSMVGQLERRLDTEMVGRELELRSLLDEFEQTCRERVPRLVTILGPAGIGKSRLAHELGATVGDRARVLHGSCLPYGEGITYWPLGELLRELDGEPQDAVSRLLAGDPHCERIAHLVMQAIGLAEPDGDTRELGWAVRRLFEALAREQPVVVVLEDIHWAEPPMLDLVQEIARRARGALLLLCMSREELLEQRPDWGEREDGRRIALAPLPERAVSALIERLAPDTGASQTLALVERAGGNPLYVEQMLALAREHGAAGDRIVTPPTLKALLAARLDRLPLPELDAIGAASVVGPQFWQEAVETLAGRGPEEVVRLIGRLVSKELIAPGGASLTGDGGFSFRHALIREAAYESLTKDRRAELHERLADWMEDTQAERVTELEAILGYHLEQAYRYHEQVAPVGEHERALATRAATRLSSAGSRAASGRQDAAAASLLARAGGLLAVDSGERLALLPQIGLALEGTANHTKAEEVYAEGLELAAAAANRTVEGKTRLGRAHVWFVARPEVSVDDILAEARRGIALLDADPDDDWLADAWRLVGEANVYEGRAAEGEQALRRALDLLGPDGSARSWNAISFAMGMCLLDGPAPLDQAAAFALDRLEAARTRSLRSMEADMLHLVGITEGRLGRFERGRAALQESAQISEELGLDYMAQWCQRSLGQLELAAGNELAAERSLRASFEVVSEKGLNSSLGETAIPLADALYRQGRGQEAEEMLARVRDEWASGDASIEAPRLALRAKLLASHGFEKHAQRVAERAVRLAGRTDWLCLQADLLLSYAEVLGGGDRHQDAIPQLQKALQVAERKQYGAAALRARDALEQLGATAPDPAGASGVTG